MPLFLIILLVIMILPIKFTVENVLVLVNFILPSNIKRKYQNSSFYLNIIKDKKALLTSKKLSDNFKLKLINKKLLKKLSTEDILNIISKLDSLDKIGNIETDFNDIEVIDRMEKCIVKNKKGLTINSQKQKDNLFKYYADDKNSSYTI